MIPMLQPAAVVGGIGLLSISLLLQQLCLLAQENLMERLWFLGQLKLQPISVLLAGEGLAHL